MFKYLVYTMQHYTLEYNVLCTILYANMMSTLEALKGERIKVLSNIDIDLKKKTLLTSLI